VLNKQVGRGKRTPAMLLRLAKSKLTIENIIYYQLQSCLEFSGSKIKHLPVAEDVFQNEKDR
jgi:hypothetical protein